MKNGGLTLWNAIAICELSKISWQMGEHLVRDDSDNHLLKDQPCRMVQWLNIIRSHQKTSQGFTTLARQF